MVDCFNSPAGTYNGPEWQIVVDVLARYMAVINSSINFIIYCIAGKQFRGVLVTLLHLKSGRINVAEVSISGLYRLISGDKFCIKYFSQLTNCIITIL